ncbi:MAG: hypothetical protein ACXWYE_08820 [Actinomycetota bacterium]
MTSVTLRVLTLRSKMRDVDRCAHHFVDVAILRRFDAGRSKVRG